MALVEIRLSEDQTEGTKATVSQWLYQVGDTVEKNQPIVELETDKVMMEVIAPETGVLTQIDLVSDEAVEDNQVLGVIDTEGNGDLIVAKNEKIANRPIVVVTNLNDSKTNSLPLTKSNQRFSPAVRRLCQQHGLDVATLFGTGKNGRVSSRDVQNHLKGTTDIRSEHLPISNMRRSIANHMVHSLLHTAPHVTSVFNLDLSAVITHRKKHKQSFAQHNANLTFTAYFIAASVKAIGQVPMINSQLHEKSIEVFKHINIGVGTALADKGLIVPVLKNCQSKTLLSISQNLSELTDKARGNKLQPSDVQGGTFTISNHGVSGSLMATPIIINQPQSAILGLGKMEKRVVVKEVDGQDVLLIKPMCYVTLTIDHRVLDAHQTNQFLAAFVEALECWE